MFCVRSCKSNSSSLPLMTSGSSVVKPRFQSSGSSSLVSKRFFATSPYNYRRFSSGANPSSENETWMSNFNNTNTSGNTTGGSDSFNYLQQSQQQSYGSSIVGSAVSSPRSRISPHSKETIAIIYDWSRKKQTGVSLKTLMDFGNQPTPGKMIQISDWLLKELPIRLARQVYYLDKLPYGLCLMRSVKRVRSWYVQSFSELYNFPKVKDAQDEQAFTELVTSIYERHSPTLITMARGLFELKQERRSSFGENDLDLSDYSEVHQFLDNFYMSRIGLRMLIGQHIELHKQLKEPRKDYSGLICKKTYPLSVAKDAIEDASYMCTKSLRLLDAPDVTIHGQTDLSFPYVPSHLYYMLFELLKNSMRAVAEFHKNEKHLPPIRVIIADSESNEDVSIKISDEGGGIARSNLKRVWSYLYSTAPFNLQTSSSEAADFSKEDVPMAGLGYGLPLSRLYARYFGGDLQLLSMESYGTDAYLHLHRIGDKEEPLS